MSALLDRFEYLLSINCYILLLYNKRMNATIKENHDFPTI